MKVFTLFHAIALGCLLCGGYTGVAQPRLYSIPTVVQLAEVDRYHLYVHARQRTLRAGYISLFFKELDKSNVHERVKRSQLSNDCVWIMDGQRLLVQCSLAGQAEYGDADGNSKYGFLLRFTSTEDADKAGAILKLEPDSKRAEPKLEK
jgi:hypothetical protein